MSFIHKFHPNVVDVEENADRESGERILGTDPKSGKPISVRLGKFGPMAQIGDAEDEEKQFASLSDRSKYWNNNFRRSFKIIFIA